MKANLIGDTVFVLTPTDTEAEEWMDENLVAGDGGEPQRMGRGIVVEHRYIRKVLVAFVKAGGVLV